MRRIVFAILTSVSLVGCSTMRDRINHGVTMTESAVRQSSRAVGAGLVIAAVEAPFIILDSWLESEDDEDRFSDHQLNRMGIERGSKEYDRLVAEDKNVEELANKE